MGIQSFTPLVRRDERQRTGVRGPPGVGSFYGQEQDYTMQKT